MSRFLKERRQSQNTDRKSKANIDELFKMKKVYSPSAEQEGPIQSRHVHFTQEEGISLSGDAKGEGPQKVETPQQSTVLEEGNQTNGGGQVVAIGVEAASQDTKQPTMEQPELPEDIADGLEVAAEFGVDFRQLIEVVENMETSEDDKDFLKDRLNGLAEKCPQNDDTIQDWICRAVDFLDEARILARRMDGGKLESLEKVTGEIQKQIVKFGGEVIFLQDWNPEKQRPISIKRSSETTETVITGFGSSGIIFKGELIRKQEVYLTMPQKTGEN